MIKQYTIREFFRQMPNAMLGRYFDAVGVAHGLDLEKVPEAKPEPWLAVWGEVADDKRPEMEADFRDIYAMGSEKGATAIYDELDWHANNGRPEATAIIEMLSALSSHFERAMVLFLEHKSYWRVATQLNHADTLTSWRKRKGLPKKDASVDDASIKLFSDLIGGYFQRTDGRGRHCVVEPYRRGERDYFFAYPEDHSQRAAEWVEGKFAPRPHNPAFEVVFVYSKDEGRLDISVKGANKILEAMQGLFAQAILKLDELPPDPKDPRVYDLNQLANPSFEFAPSPGSGIEGVAVRKIRLASVAKKGERITLEADTAQNKGAVHELLASLKKSLPMHLYYVSQVEMTADVRVSPDKKPKKISFRITHPNSCSLKYDELDDSLRDMLVASGIEPMEPEAEVVAASQTRVEQPAAVA